MGSQQEHFDRARGEWECFHQHSLALPTQARNWRLTMAFYCALHYLEGYLHKKSAAGQPGIPENFDAHHQRRTAMRACPEIAQNIVRAYRSLQDMSGQQRYDPSFVCTDAIVDHVTRNLNMVRSFFHCKLDPGAPGR